MDVPLGQMQTEFVVVSVSEVASPASSAHSPAIARFCADSGALELNSFQENGRNKIANVQLVNSQVGLCCRAFLASVLFRRSGVAKMLD